MMRLLPAFNAMQNSPVARKPSVCWRTKWDPRARRSFFPATGRLKT